jgi:1,4-dihydroxy-2-naphthoate octaprenyltransferase
MGDRRTRFFYVGLIVAAFVVLPVFGALGRPLAALAFLAVLVARRPVQRVLEGASGPALIPVLGETGRLQIVFGALLAAGLCYVP